MPVASTLAATIDLTDVDASVFLALHHALSGVMLTPMAFFSAIGGGWGSLFVVPLLIFKRTREAGRSLAATLIVIALVTFALKKIVARSRPCNCLEGVRALVFTAPSDYSFPSGHASGSAAFCVFLAIVVVKATPTNATERERTLRRLGAAALIALALCVGLSRIALGVHFPADVLSGAMLGAAVGLFGARIHEARMTKGSWFNSFN